METLRRSRISTKVVTANGEVQTNEETPVYVHELDLFVTVQPLEEALAIQSLGKLWRVGQLSQTTVDQRGEDKLIQNEQFRTASFSRLSATSGSFSSSTSTFQELSSTSPAQERSDGLAPTNWWASHPKQTQTTMNGVSEKSCEDLSCNHRTSIPRRSETNGIAERAVRRVKEGTFCIAAIRIGWKMVGCFNEMLLLSATCPTPLGSRGNSANNSFWSNGWISPDFSKRSIKASSIWRESFSGVQRSRVECGKEIFW